MSIPKTTRAWFHSLLAAAIAGGSSGVSVMIVDPLQFNLSTGAGKLLQVIAVSAIVGVALFLKQSPLPPEEEKAS